MGQAPRVPSGVQGCPAEARTSAIFSPECGAELWVRGIGRGHMLLILFLLASGDC